MKLQWETDYALRCVLCLALKGDEWVRAAELVSEIKVPSQMARKVITRLCSAGILEGKQGPGGGVRLAVRPERISVYDVVRCVEGDFRINRCLGADGICSRNGIPGCGVHIYLKELQDDIERSMRAMTFDRILAQNNAAVMTTGSLLAAAAQKKNKEGGHLCPITTEYDRLLDADPSAPQEEVSTLPSAGMI